MSTLYITEYGSTLNRAGSIPIALEPALNDQTVAISGSSAQSTALKNNTSIVRLETDAICSVLFGANPTATTGNRRMQAGDIEYFGVNTQGLKIAVISNS